MRLLMRFLKGPEVRYISHLDMQRLFQRALRRAGLPVGYSQGFHPHMLLSFASAMPLGLCSRGEYAEIQLEQETAPETAMERMNAVLLPGVRILACRRMEEAEPAVGGRIARAEYTLYPEAETDVGQILADFAAREEIILSKKTKKGMADINVRPMIHALFEQQGRIQATLSCSNSENLRADKLAELLQEEAGIPIGQIWREKIWIAVEGHLEEPLEIEE